MRLSVTNCFTVSGIPLSLGNSFSIECMKGQVWWPRIKYCANHLLCFSHWTTFQFLILPNEF